MTQQAQTQPERKPRKAALICLIVAAVLLLCAATGAVCWHLRDRQAAIQLEQAKQTHMENFNHTRTNAYRWVTEAWTRTLADQYADVVFFGDSLTAGGEWGEWYPYATCVNLGVVGDTVDGLLSRMDQVELLQPSKCFLMIGVNDLNYGMSVDHTLGCYQSLLTALSALDEDMGLETCVLSVLPVREGEMAYPTTNQQIRQLNEGIAALAEAHGMTYMDLHSAFADDTGMLRAEYSYDGLHLTDLGYQAWQEALAPCMEE